jgi:hypothetical protein
VELDQRVVELSGILGEEALRLDSGLGGVLDTGDDDVEVSVGALAAIEVSLGDLSSTVTLGDEVEGIGGSGLERVVGV